MTSGGKRNPVNSEPVAATRRVDLTPPGCPTAGPIVLCSNATVPAVARRRVPRDPNDWPPVALALDAAILTGDQDFLGCGRPTWTVDTLRTELDQH